MSDFRDNMTKEELEELHRMWSSWQCYITDPFRHDDLDGDEDKDVDDERFDEYITEFLDTYPHLKSFREEIEDYVHGW